MFRVPARIAAAAGAVLLLAGLAACATTTPSSTPSADSGYVTPGKITIATGDPAYFPYVIDNKPQSGK